MHTPINDGITMVALSPLIIPFLLLAGALALIADKDLTILPRNKK